MWLENKCLSVKNMSKCTPLGPAITPFVPLLPYPVVVRQGEQQHFQRIPWKAVLRSRLLSQFQCDLLSVRKRSPSVLAHWTELVLKDLGDW